ncbi:MAG: hypothetical protein ACRDNB_12975 [Gaiellaceae bacterium]
MSFASPYTISDTPPSELLAELDAAARALDELTARAAQLTLAMDEQAQRLKIEIVEGGRRRRLSPTQLFGLLAKPS